MDDLILRFAFLHELHDAEIDLAREALMIASRLDAPVDVEAGLAQIDGFAQAVRSRLSVPGAPANVLGAMNRLLFEELGFAGNQDDYYDPRNSFLNRVLERRLGIPITLSLVYLEVGWRLGLPLEGISFPGHFLVRYAGTRGELILDPYSGGSLLDREDLMVLLERAFGEAAPLMRSQLPGMLVGVGKRAILERMLRNLQAIYLREEAWEQALAMLNLLIALSPEQYGELRVRSRVLEELHAPRAAAQDLRRYLHRAPEADDVQEVVQRLEALERNLPPLH
jgi:regulator of sirC expression with transglutaminase-like and TPR domain